MTSLAHLSLSYHPVGQGLFASGKLKLLGYPDFNWVYDCGTSSRKSLLAKALDDYEDGFTDKKIDLVVLSHFDKDHISGLVSLLARFDVGILMLPFVPLWLRLAIAFRSGVKPNSVTFKYFLNPVKAFGSLPNVSTIVLVPSEADGTDAGELGRPRREPDKQNGLDVAWPQCAPTDEMQAEVETARGFATVGVLPAGAPVLVQSFWEYLPYNDRTVPRPPPAFVSAVEAIRDDLLKAPSDSQLSALKKTYDSQFGSGSKKRNEISLFLYAGPVEKTSTSTCAHVSSSTSGAMTIWSIDSQRLAAFYTGDGYLNTRQRIDQFVAFYKPARIAQCLCLQVMHHGAKSNWRPGIGALLAPTHAIFSAGRGGKRPRHPSGEVVKDFLPSVRLVHETIGFEVLVC